MSAPFIWVVAPLILAAVLFLVRNKRFVILVVCITTFFLTLAAWILPIDMVFTVGGLSLKFSSSIVILGRSLFLSASDRSLVAFIYGASTAWFIVSISIDIPRYFYQMGLAIISILVAAMIVEPFLYAALFIEMAVLLSIPILTSRTQSTGKGLLRFLIFQTLGMPFLLFSGWLLAGLDANPGNQGLIRQVSILIALGFTFLLAVFPFYSWIPMLVEEASPYAAGFVLWLFSTVTIFFGLGFLDRYTWLRDSANLGVVLIFVGSLIVVSAGFLAAFQRHLGRIMGYAIIMENGFSLVAIGLGLNQGISTFYILLIPRVISLVLWSFSLTILYNHEHTLQIDQAKGIIHSWPFAVAGFILANFSIVGIPLFAGFSAHLPLWEGVASVSMSTLIWLLLGSLGLFIGSIRSLHAAALTSENEHWISRETTVQKAFLLIGYLMLILLGIFPQLSMLLWTHLPNIFSHLN